MYAPKIPCVPGYEIAGVVDAIGADVTGFAVGERVAALTVYGGFAEVLVREAEHFLPIRDGVANDSSRRQSAGRTDRAGNGRCGRGRHGRAATVEAGGSEGLRCGVSGQA